MYLEEIVVPKILLMIFRLGRVHRAEASVTVVSVDQSKGSQRREF